MAELKLGKAVYSVVGRTNIILENICEQKIPKVMQCHRPARFHTSIIMRVDGHGKGYHYIYILSPHD